VVQELCGLTGPSMVAGRRTAVTRRRHTPEQVIRKLAEGQKLLAGGATVEQVCRDFQIAESTWARWLNQYGGMKADDARRLKGLGAENAELKRLANAELDKAMLKRLAEGKW
jgi:transposase-like protein